MKFLRPGATSSLVAVAVSFAITASQPALASNAQLKVIPDDTLFYFGTGKPVAWEDMLSMLPGGLDAEGLAETISEAGDGNDEIFSKISDFFNDPSAFASQWGLGEEVQFSAYTVGVMPVFRITADGEQFESAFQKATADGDLTFDIINHKGIDVRVVPLDDAPENADSDGPSAAELEASKKTTEQKLNNLKEKNQTAEQALQTATSSLESAKAANDASGIAQAANQIAEAAAKVSDGTTRQAELEKELSSLNSLLGKTQTSQNAVNRSGPGLVTAAVDSEVVFAIASDAYDPDVLDQLLGLNDPEVSLAGSGKVKKIRSEWNYGDEIAMFVDLKLIADAITGGDSLAARQIQALMADKLSTRRKAEFEALATDPCKAEIRQFAEHMPMVVSGNRRFEVSDDSLNYDSHFAVVLNNEPLRDTLKLLRGAIPASQSGSEAMLSMGLGLDVDTAPQLSAQLTEIISSINYECEVFEGINDLAKTDVSSLSLGALMFGGMARGVKGINLNIYDGDIDANAAIPVKGIDGAIAIAAEDPAALLQTLRILPQMSMFSDLPLDGTPLMLNDRIPVPLPEGAEIFAAVKDKNIVLFSGAEAEDYANRLGGNGEEGFIFSTVNTSKLISKFQQVVEQLPQRSQDSKQLDQVEKFMQSYPIGNISYKIDFTDRGIEMESVGQIERQKK